MTATTHQFKGTGSSCLRRAADNDYCLKAAADPVHAPRRRLTEADHQNRRLTEAAFLSQVVELAHLFGWRVAHFRSALTARGWRTPVQGDGAGFPDLVLVRRDRCIAAELKREVGKPSADQLLWLAAFEAAGLETAIWRPSDFDRIAEALK